MFPRIAGTPEVRFKKKQVLQVFASFILSNHQQAWPEAIQLKYSRLTSPLTRTFKKTCFKQKTNTQPNNQTFRMCFLHQGEVKEEWTTAYEDMSHCYYGYEGYGTGWDPRLGDPAGWDPLKEAFLCKPNVRMVNMVNNYNSIMCINFLHICDHF